MVKMMNPFPSVSVIMPVYNGVSTIDRAIQSVIWQTLEDWECIIVDDGSSDGTSAYLDTLNDTRFRIIHFESNRGRGEARKKGVEIAQGKYIVFLDADDWCHPERFEREYTALEQHPECVLVSCSMICFGEKSDIVMKRGYDCFKIVDFNGNNLPIFPSSMCKNELVKRYKFESKYSSCEDFFFLKQSLPNQNYIQLPDILYFYSELDSDVKEKGREAYKNGIKYCFKKRYLFFFGLSVVKFLFSSTLGQFISNETLLKSRNKPVDESEKKEFERLSLLISER